MSQTYLFLDTEWADWEGRDLVSLALVNHRTGATFYAERDPLPTNPIEFVREVVYPLLERGEFALSDLQFTQALRAFLAEAPHPVVLYDYPNDGALLLTALSGFNLLPSEVAECVAPPANLRSTLLEDDQVAKAVEDYFAERSVERARRHNALVDARALHAAWLSVRQLPDTIA